MFGCSQNTMQKLKRNKVITTMLSFIQILLTPFSSRVGGRREKITQVFCANTLGYMCNLLGGFIIGRHPMFKNI